MSIVPLRGSWCQLWRVEILVWGCWTYINYHHLPSWRGAGVGVWWPWREFVVTRQGIKVEVWWLVTSKLKLWQVTWDDASGAFFNGQCLDANHIWYSKSSILEATLGIKSDPKFLNNFPRNVKWSVYLQNPWLFLISFKFLRSTDGFVILSQCENRILRVFDTWVRYINVFPTYYAVICIS